MNALRRIAAQVQEVQVIEPPQRIEVGAGRSPALLPVHPPEIDSLRFQGMVQDFEVGLREGGIGDVESDGFAGRRIAAEPPEPWPDKPPRAARRRRQDAG
jgi:hypothetical protein